MPTIVDMVVAARAHQRAGRLDEAGKLYAACRRLAPDDLNFLIGHADFLQRTGHLEESIDTYTRAIRKAPHMVPLFDNFALLLVQNGRYADAERVLREGLSHHPRSVSLLRNLGFLLSDNGHPEQGLEYVRRAIAEAADRPDLHIDLGNILVRLRRFAEAEKAYRTAGRIRPNDPGILNNIAGVLRHQMKLGEAETLYREAVAAHPDDPDLNGNLAATLRLQGRVAEAKEWYARALELRSPWPEVHSNLLFCLDFDDESGLQEQAEARRHWREVNETPHIGKALPYLQDKDPDRAVLRLGYVSADFNRHSASDGFGSVLLNHDRSRFHVTLYSNANLEDDRTRAFVEAADVYRRIRMVTDDHLAQIIRDDRIDILVDLSGHSAGNRLPVFARRPAPVQATGWGYATSTGMVSMDYLLADRWLVPWESDRFYTEEVAALPCVLSFRVPDNLPPISEPPVFRNGFVTFGNFNRLAKVSPSCFETWARILKAVPDSRLLLKCMSLDDEDVRAGVLQRMAGLGVAEQRVTLLGATGRGEQLALHGEVDIALDSFRHCGGVTTCEALAMGVPVLTLCGDVPVARNGASILAGLGCPEWIAGNMDAYVSLACDLARSPDRLRGIRQGLRQLLRASPLGDNVRYTAEVEAGYRRMWIRYCMGLAGGGRD